MTPRSSLSSNVVLLVMALALSTSACAGFGGHLVSDAEEVKIGQQVDGSIEQEYAILADNDPVTRWARQIVTPLETASKPFRDPADIGGYKVEVIADNDLVNAFAAPGGYTYLSTGLILKASTCAEIAGVMGHELAHVTEQHGVEAIEAQYGTAFLAQLVLGEGLATDVVNGVQAFLLNTTYSRDKEEEADEIGLQIAFGGGYNPYGLVDFFEKLLAMKGGSGGPPKFLSSHPATKDRIKDVSNRIQKRYGDRVVRGQRPKYTCPAGATPLADIQKRIRDGRINVRPGTGTGQAK